MTEEHATAKPVGNARKKRTRMITEELEKGMSMKKGVRKSLTSEKEKRQEEKNRKEMIAKLEQRSDLLADTVQRHKGKASLVDSIF
jgi:hypothetical protein